MPDNTMCESTPEIRIVPSMLATMRNSKLLPVLSAASASTITPTMNQRPSRVTR